MDLWEYTKMATPILLGAFVISFVIIGTVNAVWALVERLRPRGRDQD